jgi:hypothetical protein
MLRFVFNRIRGPDPRYILTSAVNALLNNHSIQRATALSRWKDVVIRGNHSTTIAGLTRGHRIAEGV